MRSETPIENTQGIVLILLGALLLSVMDAVVKVLLDGGYGVLQILAVRSWLIVPAMWIWAQLRLPPGALRTRRPGVLFVRVVVGFFAPYFFFRSLETLPLADATVIFFGSSFIMTALSVPILKETVGPHRWGAVGVGFLGVVVAANPGGAFWTGGAVFAVLASVSYALFMVITRLMGPGEGAFKQVLYFYAWVGVVASLSVVGDFRAMPVVDVAWVGGLGIVGVAGHLCLTRGFSIAPIGVLAPFEYSAMVWASLIGFAIWGDVPGRATWAGAGIIVISGLYLLHREQQIRRLRSRFAVPDSQTLDEEGLEVAPVAPPPVSPKRPPV